MADLNQVEDAARTLLHAEGFGYVPFKFERNTERFGYVLVDHQTGEGIIMKMSRSYAIVNTFGRCLDNIRHEVAHLLAWDEIADHGPAWKAAAIRLGLALPVSTFDERTTVIPTFWHGFIPKSLVKPLDIAA